MIFDKQSLETGKTYPRVTRVLVYPNVTYTKNLEQDSFVDVIKWQVEGLNAARGDLFFYLIMPSNVAMPTSLERWAKAQRNVKLSFIHIPTHPPVMRGHFNTVEVSEVVAASYDFDVVYCHTPEHVPPLSNLISNSTHHEPGYLGYAHWFDFAEVVKWRQSSFWSEVDGLLKLEKCFLNTKAQAAKVVEEAGERYNAETLAALEERLVPNYLGAVEATFGKQQASTQKIIAFNHRPWEYKGFPEFMQLMDKLWKRRQDFKVWVPLLAKPNREYVVAPGPASKKAYLRQLGRVRVGFSPRQRYEGWSVATLDGIARGVPYIAYDAGYYHELCPKMEFYSTSTDALGLLEAYLEDEDYRNKQGRKQQRYVRNHRMLAGSVAQVGEAIDEVAAGLRRVSPLSEGLERAVSIIKTHGAINKEALIKELRWGAQIVWSPYRQALLDRDDIVEVSSPIPIYVYERRKKVRLTR